MSILDSIPWDQLIPIIVGLIGNCRTNGEEAVIQEMRNPGPWTRLRIRRAARKADLDLTSEQWDEVFRRGSTASQLELQTLVRDSWGMF